MRDHRTFLRSIGRKPLPKQTRTAKNPGDVEIVWCPKTRDYVRYVHEGQAGDPVDAAAVEKPALRAVA